MEVSYQYANRDHTSLMLKFKNRGNSQSINLLVDSGNGVDVDRILDEDEYLTGILLTHLHRDHYATIDENLRDGAEIYTSQPNIGLLPTILNDADTHSNRTIDTEAVQSAAKPIGGEITIGGQIKIQAVPAGHVPGATAFYLEFPNGNGTERIFITGDFTRRTVAGCPGVPLQDADLIVLTGTTDEDFTDSLTDATTTTLHQSLSGSPTLVTASGFNGLHFAYVLGHAIKQQQPHSTGVSIVGQAAKIHNALGYDIPNVTAYPEYDSQTILEENPITISGPEIPSQGGSKLLYDQIRNDPNATHIQLADSDRSDSTDGQCTVNEFSFVNHPTEETIQNLVDFINPKEVIVTHQTGKDLVQYRNKFASVVWAPTKQYENTVFKDGDWLSPHCMEDGSTKRLLNARPDPVQLDLPNPDPSSIKFEQQPVDLSTEGLDLNRILNRPSTTDTKYSTTETPTTTPPDTSGTELRTDGSTSVVQNATPASQPKQPNPPIEQELKEIKTRLDAIEDKLGGGNGTTAEIAYVDKDTILLKHSREDPVQLESGDTVELLPEN